MTELQSNRMEFSVTIGQFISLSSFAIFAEALNIMFIQQTCCLTASSDGGLIQETEI